MLLAAAGLLGAGGCGGADGGEELLVSAAASLRDVLVELARDYEDANPGARVRLNTGGSAVLLRQLERGAPADVFVAASPEEIDRLGRALGDPPPAVPVASNRLVLAVPAGTAGPRSLEELREPRWSTIAVGNPGTAPLGRYTRQALQASGTIEDVESRLVPAENALLAVAWVARGEVDAAVLYHTDALRESRRVTVSATLDPRLHAPIVYHAVRLPGSHGSTAAERFVDHLASRAARRVFAAHGFDPPPEP